MALGVGLLAGLLAACLMLRLPVRQAKAAPAPESLYPGAYHIESAHNTLLVAAQTERTLNGRRLFYPGAYHTGSAHNALLVAAQTERALNGRRLLYLGAVLPQTATKITYTVILTPTPVPAGTPGPVLGVAPQAPTATVLLTATVGVDPHVCAKTASVRAPAQTRVYFCYTLANTSPITFTLHDLVDSGLGFIWQNRAFPMRPGAVTNTVAAGIVISATTTGRIVHSATWTAKSITPAVQASASAKAEVDLISAALAMTKTVGLDLNRCAAARAITMAPGKTVAYCLSLQNTGQVTFTHLALADAALGLDGVLTYTLAPAARLVITAAKLSALGLTGTLTQADVVQDVVNRAVVTATAGQTFTDDTGRHGHRHAWQGYDCRDQDRGRRCLRLRNRNVDRGRARRTGLLLCDRAQYG